MRASKTRLLGLLLCAFTLSRTAETSSAGESGLISVRQERYFWKTSPAGDSAELLTLFCRLDLEPGKDVQEVPLVAVLRDTLNQPDPDTSRISYVWLLNHPRLTMGQRILSAVPFFYWTVGDGSKTVEKGAPSPLLNLTAPLHPVLSGMGHGLLQWAVLDPTAMGLRATSRAYRTNQVNEDRLQLEEAISYVRNAPPSRDLSNGLTQTELDTVIARLELRKRFLGGLMGSRNVAEIGRQTGWEDSRIQSRNWELVRQCAEKTGLLFEPVNVAGDEYAMLWFPVATAPPVSGAQNKYAWRVLRIGNPWSDDRVRQWHGVTYSRQLDASGNLLPEGMTGEREIELIPLAVYSLSYPKAPLLMVDFRDGFKLRRHEMTQRALNEITSGFIGLSHFTNWYYYADSANNNFYIGRTGSPTNQAERLDAYSQFRAHLAIDTQLNPGLRKDLQAQLHSLGINPRVASLKRSAQIAGERYARLLDSISDHSLMARLEKDRRAELAQFGQTRKSAAAYTFLHATSLGLYTHRAPESPDTLNALERSRQVNRQLAFLDSLVSAGTQPEVAYEPSRIRSSVTGLSSLMPSIHSPALRAHAMQSLLGVQKISKDATVQAECSLAAESIRKENSRPNSNGEEVAGGVRQTPGRVHGVAAATRVESMK